MADERLSESTNEIITPAATDRLYLVEGIGGTPVNGHIEYQNLMAIEQLGTPTYKTVQHAINLLASTGRTSGGAISVNASVSTQIDVAAGTGWIKATDSDVATILSFDWEGTTGTAIPTDTIRYVGIIYNSGTPIVSVKTSDTWDLDTEFPLGKVINEGDKLYILNNPWWVGDGITNVIERIQAQGGLVRDTHYGGLITSVTGTRNLAVTGGIIWSRLVEFLISAINTSVPAVASHSTVFDVDNGSSKGTITASAGTPYSTLWVGMNISITGTGDNNGVYKIETITGGNVVTFTTVIAGTDGTEAATVLTNTFELYKYNGVAGTWSDTNVTQYPVTSYNDMTSADIVALTNNYFTNMWVYAEADDNRIALVYGQNQFLKSADAETATPPTNLPVHISENSLLIGRIIIQEGVDAAVQVDSAFETLFSSAQASDHGNLAGLDDDDHPQYIKDSEFTADSEILVGTGSGTFQKESGATARTSLGAAASGANSDITSLTGLTSMGALPARIPVTDSAANFAANFTGADLYGGTFVCNSAGTCQLPEMAAGMNFTIITLGDIEVIVDTNAADGYLMDGVTNAEGKNITNLSTAGDMAVFQYYTADDWLITTNGWTPEA